MKPTIGRIVLYRGVTSNGAEEHPAIVTRVWSDICVNLHVLLDNATPVSKTSVVQDEEMKQPQGWRWPPRDDAQNKTLTQGTPASDIKTKK